jgi:glycosyltransferase involved in cell wall biosynthesis
MKAKGVYVMVASSGGVLENAFSDRGIPHKKLNLKTKFEFAPKVLMSALKLARLVRDENIDVIHAHTRVSQVASVIASRLTGVAYVTTCHGFFKKRARGIFDTWGDKVIAISDAVKEHLVCDLGVKDERIEVIYNGVDIDHFTADCTAGEIENAKRGLGLKKGPIIGTIGRLSSVKGQKFLIHAMAEVISKCPDAQAVIIGDGNEDVPLKNLAGSLGISNSVHFLHSVPDTHSCLSVMDIFVFPSVKEGLGIALLEAMASGKACVTSDAGGIRNAIEDGVTGLLTPVGNSDAISRAILKLIENNDMRKTLGSNARSLAIKKFSLDDMAGKMIGLYEGVAA